MEMNTKKQRGRCTVNRTNSGEKSRDGEYENSSTDLISEKPIEQDNGMIYLIYVAPKTKCDIGTARS